MRNDTKNRAREKHLNKLGFTLIEISIVIVIVGIILIPLSMSYKIYQQKKAMETTIERMKDALGYVNITKDANLDYPCPALRNLAIGDPMRGIDACTDTTWKTTLNGLSIGSCTSGGGICKIAGIRDADGDTINDPILIGALPFATMAKANKQLIGAEDVLDGWDNQIDYVISANLTSLRPSPIEVTDFHLYGVIKAIDEFNRPTSSIGTIDINNDSIIDDNDANGLYALISHGKDGAGAYSNQGALVTSCTSTRDGENCDNDATFMRALGVYEGNSSQYYDDYVLFNREQSSDLWKNIINPDTRSGTGDITNLNSGNIGIGTNSPAVKLEVAGDIRAPTVLTNTICDETGSSSNCLDVNYFVSTLTSGAITNTCPNAGEIIKGIANKKVVCGKVIINNSGAHSCPPGEHVRGMYTDGRVICTDFNIY